MSAPYNPNIDVHVGLYLKINGRPFEDEREVGEVVFDVEDQLSSGAYAAKLVQLSIAGLAWRCFAGVIRLPSAR